MKHLAGEQVFEEKPVQEIEDVTKDEKIEQPKFGPEDSLQEGVEEFDKKSHFKRLSRLAKIKQLASSPYSILKSLTKRNLYRRRKNLANMRRAGISP